jgi:hypothetical protein
MAYRKIGRGTTLEIAGFNFEHVITLTVLCRTQAQISNLGK